MTKYMNTGAFLAIGLFAATVFSVQLFNNPLTAEDLRLDEQEATVRVIKKASPAVVSIVVSGQQTVSRFDPATNRTQTETVKRQLGAGSGFLISSDGLILTNKHVVAGTDNVNNDYRVTLNSGKRYYAQLIGLDPANDLAVMKIFDKNLPFLELGDSDKTEIGYTVIAIGNALGRYRNSATKGIISGLGRNLAAADSSGNFSALTNVIQTDAEINPGNSGGPLLNLEGKVVGINVAIDEAGSSIGFAIPINDAKPVVKSVRETGRIIRPRLGVYYTMITPELAEEKKLKSETGALVGGTQSGDPSIVPDSPAAKAGVLEGDIILEVDGKKATLEKPLYTLLQNYAPGKKAGLRILRNGEILVKIVELDEFK